MLKKLPIGIQTFSKIVKGNYLYIDKTKEALDLIEDNTYYFLSRPRRFGKSLFLDTLKNIFEGNKEYFKDLYIYDKYDWNQKYPVIKISWAGCSYVSMEEMEEKANEELRDVQIELNLQCEDNISPQICFKRLIQKAYEQI